MPIIFNKIKDLVTIQVSEPISNDDFSGYTMWLDSILYRKDFFYLMIDLRELEDIPYTFIMKQGLYMKKRASTVEECVGASTIVYSNPKIAKVLDLLFSLKAPNRPNLVTKDPTDAIKFLTEWKTSILAGDTQWLISVAGTSCWIIRVGWSSVVVYLIGTLR